MAVEQLMRKFDAAILGASGFTGKYVLREWLRCTQKHSRRQRLTLAVAGRSRSKLEAALLWAGHGDCCHRRSADDPDISIIDNADATDAASLRHLCRSTRVLVNCVGPCNQYGEAVVAACVEAGTHYVDISGEAEFMERIEAKFHDAALAAKVLVVSACAAVSIVSDVGLLHHLRCWPSSSAPSSVFAYARIHSFASNHVASAETGILALANAEALTRFRRSLPRRPSLKIPGPPPPIELDSCIHYEKKLGYWAAALPICDRSVVRRTFWALHGHPRGLPVLNAASIQDQENFDKAWQMARPVHFRLFLAIKTLRWAVIFCWATRILKTLSRHTFGLNLLLKYPHIFTIGAFTHQGPTEKQVEEGSFEMWFVGKGDHKELDGGVKAMKVVTRVKGPEPCYTMSAIGIVQCALLCLHSRDLLPIGGVLTTACAFGGANIQESLEGRGLLFQHINTTSKDNNEPEYEDSLITLKPWIVFALPIILGIATVFVCIFVLSINIL
ncbi:hypothetical protein KP509_24G056900 [Ceratopteris richardii]|uniref:Saccharopine dehydrogenase NADP binding domain-containing protein n=1 Tax=Ceratopteris richardii TaxID=49495 RepID=A0A8T2RXZ2_CERRI|nr:hypothetical protein KP509_24G056900 [Ceratopteris richardii]